LSKELGERDYSGLRAYRPEPFLNQYFQVIEEERRKKRAT